VETESGLDQSQGGEGSEYSAGEVEGDFGGNLGLPLAPGSQVIRCTGCHEVLELEELIENRCPKCGCPYTPPKKAEAPEGSFAARYVDQEGVDELAPETQAVPRTGMPVLLAAGLVLLVLAVAVAGLMMAGVFNGPKEPTPTPYHTPNTVISKTSKPTLPQAVYQTLDYLADPDFNARVEVDSSVMVGSRVSSKPGTARSHLAVDVAGGEEFGTLTIGRSTYEFYVTRGALLSRLMPSGKWSNNSGIAFVILTPLFDLTEPNQLNVAEETYRDGVPVFHLVSSSQWRPDVMRLAVMGAGTLDQFKIQGGALLPDHYTLDLYVTTQGAPVSAEYHAWAAASDGSKVLALDTYYTFTNVAMVEPIPTPSGL
jgi:hypothetical protein